MQEFEAKTCPEQYLLDKVEELHRQRDQLREALQDMMLGMDPERHDQARAALKATEEG